MLNFRESPNVDSEILYTMHEGDVIYISEISNGWGKTKINGVEGWLNLKYTEKY